MMKNNKKKGILIAVAVAVHCCYSSGGSLS